MREDNILTISWRSKTACCIAGSMALKARPCGLRSGLLSGSGLLLLWKHKDG